MDGIAALCDVRAPFPAPATFAGGRESDAPGGAREETERGAVEVAGGSGAVGAG